MSDKKATMLLSWMFYKEFLTVPVATVSEHSTALVLHGLLHNPFSLSRPV